MREAISWLMKVPALPESNKIRTSLESINPLSLNVLFFLLAEEIGCNCSTGLTAITTCPLSLRILFRRTVILLLI
jgi:hypothetical protein